MEIAGLGIGRAYVYVLEMSTRLRCVTGRVRRVRGAIDSCRVGTLVTCDLTRRE